MLLLCSVVQTWSVIDLFASKPLISALITYFVFHLVVYARETLGQRNVARIRSYWYVDPN